jgi:hypothetical protein
MGKRKLRGNKRSIGVKKIEHRKREQRKPYYVQGYITIGY